MTASMRPNQVIAALERLEKDVKMLKDTLNIRDNWHAVIRDWIGQEVRVCDRSEIIHGELKWSDRYNVCVSVESNNGEERTRIYTKGGINWIEKI